METSQGYDLDMDNLTIGCWYFSARDMIWRAGYGKFEIGTTYRMMIFFPSGIWSGELEQLASHPSFFPSSGETLLQTGGHILGWLAFLSLQNLIEKRKRGILLLQKCIFGCVHFSKFSFATDGREWDERRALSLQPLITADIDTMLYFSVIWVLK